MKTRPHKCQDCPRSFATKGGLATHSRSHALHNQRAESVEAGRRARERKDGLTPPGVQQSIPIDLDTRNAITWDGETLADLARKRDAIDRAIASLVTGERDAGAPWSEIGRALGVSKQAAQQHYGK